VPSVAEHELELTFLRHLPLTAAAVAWAVERHAGQRREADGAAFVMHPIEVAALVDGAQYPDFVVATAVLHDLLENTDVTADEIEERFGSQVAELVEAVSDDPSLPTEEERKRDLRDRVRRIGGYAAVVYAADKVSKMREIRMALAAGVPREQLEVKIRRHQESLAMLEQITPGRPLVELLRFELEALDEPPPTAGSA
jgi:(p)ppGpp synthase/HD superfamily hydrolase